MFTKLFEKEGISLNVETKKVVIRPNYDVYYEKNMDIMHMVCKNGVWYFKFPKEQGVPCFAKTIVPKRARKSAKVPSTKSSHTTFPSMTPSLLEHR